MDLGLTGLNSMLSKSSHYTSAVLLLRGRHFESLAECMGQSSTLPLNPKP